MDNTEKNNKDNINPIVSSGRCKQCFHLEEFLVAGLCVTHWCQEMDRKEGLAYRWFIEENGVEREVSKEEWVEMERQAGFHNKMGHPEEPATAGFYGNNIKGRKEQI